MSFAEAAGHRDPRDGVALELQRVVLRLQSLGPQRVAAHEADVRAALEILADAAWAAEFGEPALAGGPERPALPALPPHAAADQLTVVTRDLLDARPDEHTLHEAAETLVTLRRTLP
ncbi:hypothetical protein JT358_07510 [Micrococcales bacterium 31B]|nr:hypothetical protein [Micrococcales bacterium 31B]